MKLLFDLFPVILFVVAYVMTDSIYVATAVIIPASIAQVVYAKLRYGKVDRMLLASMVLVVVMGGLTPGVLGEEFASSGADLFLVHRDRAFSHRARVRCGAAPAATALEPQRAGARRGCRRG